MKATFEGSQGGMLSAALDMPAGGPRAFALFAHCFSCSKDIRAARDVARALADEGYGVLRFDFTGLGRSEGDFANTNFSSNVDDLVAAADFLRREHEAPSLLIGHSLGGAAAIVAARRIPEARGVATIGAPSEAAHVARQLEQGRDEIEARGAATISLAGRPFTIKKQFLDDIAGARVRDAAAALKMPFLILHAPRDETVGIDNASELFIAAKHPKSFVSLDDADHLLSDPKDARYAARTIAAWASRFVADAAAATGEAPPGEALSGRPPVGGAPDVEPLPGGARAVARVSESLAVDVSIDGHPFVLDAGVGDGGAGLGPNPTRTVEAALAACAAITMRMYARRKDWPLTGLRVDVSRAPGTDAHVSRRLVKTVWVDGPLDADQRARLLEIADKCPVHRMLAERVEIESGTG
ncbi:MAG: alpha/beta fold hydrolase [Alphaproteobacteria bacterium]|nr:alpha/beta fold hydrolase [Alphaproteobacteria bacterium]